MDLLPLRDRLGQHPGVNWPATCAIVIPCLNEGLTIAGLVREARNHLPTVIVVDDGSIDDTAVRAAEAGAQLIQHPRNLGKGAALKSGLAAAMMQSYGWAITMDGDGQHRPEDIPGCLRCAEQTGASLVVGNRMPDAQRIPWLRRAVNRWMSRQLSRRAGRQLPDSQCGFRLTNLGAYAALCPASDHFEVESEILLSFVKAGLRVEFIPIRVIGRSHHSHIAPVLDTWRWFRWWWRTGGG